MRARSLSVGLVFCAVALAGCGSGGGSSSSDTTLGPLGSTQYKTIPTTSTTVTGGASATSNANPPPLGSGGTATYTIVAGDYLYGIAKKLSCTADKLVSQNGWPDGVNHPLIPGQTMSIPPDCKGGGATTTQTTQSGTGVTVSGGNSTGTTTRSGSGSTIAAGASYTVKSGDTLVGIAKQFGTTAQSIVAANGWSDGLQHVIYPGLKIKLPAKTG